MSILNSKSDKLKSLADHINKNHEKRAQKTEIVKPDSSNEPSIKKAILAFDQETLTNSPYTKITLARVVDSPYQPRLRPITKTDVAELMKSIAAAGQTTPIVVTPNPDNPDEYHVHQGHRRCAALRFLEATTVKAIVRHNIDKKQSCIIAYADNMGREDLTAYEQAHAIHIFAQDFEVSFEEAAKQLGVSRASMYRLKNMTTCSHELQACFRDYGTAMAIADMLAKIEQKTPQKAQKLAKKLYEGAISNKAIKKEFEALQEKGVLVTKESIPCSFIMDDERIIVRIALQKKDVTKQVKKEIALGLQQLIDELEMDSIHPTKKEAA